MAKTAVAWLKAKGLTPFIVPAMGSHGGAVAEGQVKLLAELGFTPDAMGCPIEATMEVVRLGTTSHGLPVYFDANARIRGGGGEDTLVVQGQDLNLALLDDDLITGIDIINLINGSSTNNGEMLSLDYLEVLALSDDNELTINADPDDVINIDPGWTLVDETEIGNDTFLTYTQGVATLHINYIDVGG